MAYMVTKVELMGMANSSNAAERRKALELYNAWKKASPRLHFKDRLTATECNMIDQIFAKNNPKPSPQRR